MPLDDRAVMLRKPAMPCRGERRFRPARHHHVAASAADQSGRVADRVGTGGAGGDGVLTRALPAVAHRHCGRRRVGHHHRDQERADPPFALLVADDDLFLERGDPSDAGADEHPAAEGVGLDRSGLLDRQRGGGQRELGERSERRASFGLSNRGSGSNSSMLRAPVRAGPHSPAKKSSLPVPHGDTTPMPVTATAEPSELVDDQVVRGLDRLDPLELLLVDADVELLLEAMTSSTRSRLSASRSSAKRASRVT